jgi:hypothetical protein
MRMGLLWGALACALPVSFAADIGDGLREWLITNAASGIDVGVTARIAGQEFPSATIQEVDASGVRLRASGLSATVPWKAFDAESMYLLTSTLLKRMPAGVAVEALLLGARTSRRDDPRFRQALDDLRQRSPADAHQVDVIIEQVRQSISAASAAAPARPVTQAKPKADPSPLANQVPWDLPGLSAMRPSKHKVFAHYFLPFPVSIDNLPPASDYYARNYLLPEGENGKFAARGGFLRERPLPRAPVAGADWRLHDLIYEAHLARDAGLDGFVVDLLGADDHEGSVRRLLDAAQAVDPDFRIMLMPDMTSELRAKPDRLVPLITEIGHHPACFRLADGRLVVAPYCANIFPVDWWRERLKQLESAGLPVALVPLFQGWTVPAPLFAPISYGFSEWGGRTPIESRSIEATVATIHRYVPVWMQPVAPQDMRPKDGAFLEAAGSLTFRTQWENAIRGGADWVQLITWNDYSECTEIAPSTGIGYAFYDLTAFYTAWFKTGVVPAIRQDALMAFHRIQRSDVRLRLQKSPWINRLASEPTRDEIELLAFLTAPGEVEISIGSDVVRSHAEAGLTIVHAPLRIGTPTFTLARNGKSVIAMRSPWTVVAEADYQDFLYHAVVSYRSSK